MLADLRAAGLSGMAVIFASIPMIAVVSHKNNPPEPMIYPAAKVPNGLNLYNAEGEKIATCEKLPTGEGEKLANCKIEDGYTFDDVMNSWLKAYEGK
jgi:hypothetical protein